MQERNYYNEIKEELINNEVNKWRGDNKSVFIKTNK